MRTERRASMRALIFVAMAVLAGLTTLAHTTQDEKKLRRDLEKELPAVQAAFRSAPGEAGARRAYADLLFRLGNMWEANEVMAPLVTFGSANTHDLELAARIALMLSDYDRAEALYTRLRDVAQADSEALQKAVSGLVMTYYQTNQYSKTKNLNLGNQGSKIQSLLTFMQKFPGEPYQIEWANDEKVAHLRITNDFRRPAALPLMKVQVNGHDVQFFFDTGGDMLYIDRGVAEKVGIRNIHERESKYAYTGGDIVTEQLGVAQSVRMGEVTIRNVPVIVANFKDRGVLYDGALTTQVLKQFLSRVDYEKAEITLRERSDRGRKQMLEMFGSSEPHRVPFFMFSTHLMFTKGSINGRKGLNLLVDSGLASNMALVVHDETVEDLGLEKTPIPGTKYFAAAVESHGIGTLTRGPASALGNVMVEEDAYRSFGFIFDALISHQYLYHLGSWTIDFDSMNFYFPSEVEEVEPGAGETAGQRTVLEVSEAELEKYVGSYHSDMIRSELVVAVSEGKLAFTASGNLQGSFTLVKTGEHRFEAEDAPQKVVLDWTVVGDRATSVAVTVSGQGPFPFIRRQVKEHRK